MRKLTVAMVAPCPFPSLQGTQVFIGQLARSLGERGHRVHLVTYHYGGGRIHQEYSLHRSLPLPFSGKMTSGPSLQKPLFDLLLTAQLDRVVRQTKADIIHAHNYEGALAGLMVGRWRKVPLVFHTHNTMTHELPCYSRSRLGRRTARWLGRFLDRHLPRRADACIAVAPQIADFIEEMGTSADITWTIFPAIDLAQFEQNGTQAQGARPLLLYAGNLDEYQNLSFILQCFQSVLARRPDCHLSIVTHSSPLPLTRTAARLGLGERLSILQTDSFETMKAQLGRCHLALCPRVSPYGFPMKLLNYLAAGKPVVACRSSAHGLTHMVDGWVVEDNDVDAFSDAVVTLIADEGLRQRLSQNARRTAEEKFSWEISIGRYEEVYMETLKRWDARVCGN